MSEPVASIAGALDRARVVKYRAALPEKYHAWFDAFSVDQQLRLPKVVSGEVKPTNDDERWALAIRSAAAAKANSDVFMAQFEKDLADGKYSDPKTTEKRRRGNRTFIKDYGGHT